MSHDLWIAVVSSSLLTSALTAIITGTFVLRAKRNEYANDYFKLVLERRLDAYEAIERLIVELKVAVLDVDQRPYHRLFSKDDDRIEVYRLLVAVLNKSLWLSDELFTLTRSLNILVYNNTSGNVGLIEFGKQHYIAIGKLRTKIERTYAEDMLVLHEVPRFLKRKNPSDAYTPIPPQRPSPPITHDADSQ